MTTIKEPRFHSSSLQVALLVLDVSQEFAQDRTVVTLTQSTAHPSHLNSVRKIQYVHTSYMGQPV